MRFAREHLDKPPQGKIASAEYESQKEMADFMDKAADRSCDAFTRDYFSWAR